VILYTDIRQVSRVLPTCTDSITVAVIVTSAVSGLSQITNDKRLIKRDTLLSVKLGICPMLDRHNIVLKTKK